MKLSTETLRKIIREELSEMMKRDLSLSLDNQKAALKMVEDALPPEMKEKLRTLSASAFEAVVKRMMNTGTGFLEKEIVQKAIEDGIGGNPKVNEDAMIIFDMLYSPKAKAALKVISNAAAGVGRGGVETDAGKKGARGMMTFADKVSE